MSEGYVIGVDHGYAAMKTVHGSFPSGLVAYEHEPYTQKNVLEYSGTYYVVYGFPGNCGNASPGGTGA